MVFLYYSGFISFILLFSLVFLISLFILILWNRQKRDSHASGKSLLSRSLSYIKHLTVLITLCLLASLCFYLFKLIKDHFIKNFNVSSLHTGWTGFDHTCTLEFTQCIYDHGSGDTYTVSDLAGNQDTLIPIQLIKNMDCLLYTSPSPRD